MRKLIAAALLLFSCGSAKAVTTYQAVRASTSNIITPTLQTGTMNLSSGTIQNFRASTATFTNVVTTTETLTSLTVSTLNVTSSGTISSLNAPIITVSSITISTATLISSSTVISASITNLGVSSMTTTLPMSARKITGLANGTQATDAMAFGQLITVQKVSAQTTVSSATASTTFVPMNIVKSITPTSASNKVRITVSFLLDVASTALGNQCVFSIFKSSTTNLGNAAQGFGFTTNELSSVTADTGARIAIVFEDSPGTTSPVWYGIYMLDGGVSAGSGTCTTSVSSQPAQIILEEVTPG